VFHNVAKVVLRDRGSTLASFSEDDFHFSWHVQHFGRVHIHFAWQAQHFQTCRRIVLFLMLLRSKNEENLAEQLRFQSSRQTDRDR